MLVLEGSFAEEWGIVGVRGLGWRTEVLIQGICLFETILEIAIMG